MITRLSLPIDLLHDERIVALVADCGPQSIAVLISLHAILRRRGSIARDRYLIAKIRHDLSYTLDEAAVTAILDHLTESGYLQAAQESASQKGVRSIPAPSSETAPSGETSCDTIHSCQSTLSCKTDAPPAPTDSPDSIVSPDSPDSPDSVDSIDSVNSPFSPAPPRGCDDAASSPQPDDTQPDDTKPELTPILAPGKKAKRDKLIDPFLIGVWRHSSRSTSRR